MLSFPKYLTTCVITAALSSVNVFAADKAVSIVDDPAYMWDLSDLYATPAAWTREHDALSKRTDALARLKGTLGHSAGSMLKALDAISRVQKEAARLGVYANLKGDENVTIGDNQERKQAAQMLTTEIGVKTSWLVPEIIGVGGKKVAKFETQSRELKHRFGLLLDNALRNAPHTLSAEGERVMAASASVLAQPDNIFMQLVDGEFAWPTVTLSSGERVKVDQPNYEKYRQSPNREDRKKVFDAFFGALGAYKGTLGSTLTTQVMGEEFDANVRHFPNALADAVFADNMPESVYRTLVAQVNRSLPTLYRYLQLRKKTLGITDSLQYYDMYAPIFTLKEERHYSIDEMKQITLNATALYGPEYAAMLQKGFAGRWMNLFPHDGKAGGAYMNGSAYDVHPYLLFNNHDDYESLTTFAHEWGHAVHTLLTTQNQPYDKSQYSTFIAETASIGNEMLLNDYMVAHAGNNAEKLFYLGQGLESIRTTFYRQSMFAEFQLAIHDAVEKGGTLSGASISGLYCDVVKRYYGDAQGVTRIDPAYCSEWSFVPHFYYGFYVYQYATSIAGAAHFTDAMAHEGAPARDRFLTMLKAGGSDYAYVLYKQAGLDMTTAEPYDALVARMNRIMDQIEAIQRSGS
ncbi:MAG: M3 family oligoendopeptidase [Burkholderiales bacterium]